MEDTASLTLSKMAFDQASELGCEMAKDDQVLKPDLRHAHRYEGYSRFRNAHREEWERKDVFEAWQDRLFALAEREGERLGLRMDDSMASWDVWYHRIVAPLKEALWEAWEHSWDLAALYAEANPTGKVAEVVPSGPLDAIHRYLSLLGRSETPPLADEIDAAIWH
jgi:hypothetical protein